MFKRLEFFTFPNGEVWYNDENRTKKLESSNRELIDFIFTKIEDLYPTALEALSKEYSGSMPNILYFRYKIVSRFIRCNFAEHDTLTADIEDDGHFSFEEVKCPMRGECKFEGVICRPKLKTKLSPREMEVAKYLAHGFTQNEIAEQLEISPCTIRRHIANIKDRLHLRKTHELIAWVATGRLEL